VGCDLAEVELAEIAADLLQRACLKEHCRQRTGLGSHQCQQQSLILYADHSELPSAVHSISVLCSARRADNFPESTLLVGDSIAVSSHSGLFVIRPDLRHRHYSFLVTAPENFPHSNGISVLLHAAQLLQSSGLNVSIVPADSSHPRFTRLPYPFDDLPISWRAIPGSCAILGDTLTPERLLEVRENASQICHYTMAPLGLFRGEGCWGNRVVLLPGERQAVYSPMISAQIPTFYLQSRFPELEPWIEAALSPSRCLTSANKPRRLRASIYAGKGYLRPLPHALRSRINRSQSRLITRFEPSTKQALYELLSQTDFLVCFDPLTSLAHEAILMGIPVFIPIGWDETGVKHSFPVRLDGVVWNDVDQFLNILDHGYDHQAIVRSYRSALARNAQSLADLLSFGFTDSSPQPSAAELNAYWDSRQEFFASLNLPSPPSAWAPIEAALPASTISEHFKMFIVAFCMSMAAWSRKLSSVSRSLTQRLRRLRPH